MAKGPGGCELLLDTVKQPRRTVIMWVTFVTFAALLATVVIPSFSTDPSSLRDEDIFYAWREGDRIASGQNPYSRIHRSNMSDNRKYPTYFPGFYVLSAGSQLAGAKDFATWAKLWRAVFFCCYAAVGWLLFWEVSRRGPFILGALTAAFWFFNRWSVHVIQIAHIEPLSILLLIGSLLLFDRRRRTSYLLLGASLAIKQIAIFLVPVFLALELRQWQGWPTVKRTISALCWILLIPTVVMIPFLIWDASGLAKSVLFSATRSASSHVGAPSLSQIMGVTGLVGRLPMLAMMALLYFAAFRRYLGIYATSFWVLSVFVMFNDVLFRQYFVWTVVLLPLALFETQPFVRTQQDRRESG
jgi:uncharacterized membrane protein